MATTAAVAAVAQRGGGFPWIDDGDPTGKTPERKMKRCDKSAGYGRKEREARGMKNARRRARAREVNALATLRDIRSRHEYTGYTSNFQLPPTSRRTLRRILNAIEYPSAPGPFSVGGA